MGPSLKLGEDQRIAISELLSIALLPLGRTCLDSPPELQSDIAENIQNRVMDLLYAKRQGAPWKMSDESIIDCLTELQRRKLK
jgi:hypothetical protein